MDKLLHFLVASSITITIGQFVPKKYAASAVLVGAAAWEVKYKNDNIKESFRDFGYSSAGVAHGVGILYNSEKKRNLDSSLINDMEYKIRGNLWVKQ